MRKSREISVELNHSENEKDLKELESRKARIIINILKDKYGEIQLEEIIDSIKLKVKTQCRCNRV